tara:strand:- start:173 stop:916 length:744 start_codon:yes stop_codon:yes gene_type:complete
LFNWKNFLKLIEKKTLGIINVTNDSFSGDGILNSKNLLDQKFDLAFKNNINFLDVGCMSTKPDFKMLSTVEELNRLNFFVENMSDKFYYSIDTFNSSVAERALDSGFLVINDVSGFVDSKMIELAIQRECGIIVMHRNPVSENIHQKGDYSDVVDQVNSHLMLQTENLINKGVNKSQIAIDPGLGFGKKMDDSKELFLNLNNLINTYPVVVGYSRKKFTEHINMTENEMIEHCIDSGVDLLRLHVGN